MSGAAAYLPIATFRVGSFNIGVYQDMLNGKNAMHSVDYTERIIKECVAKGRLHVMNLCELGGHRQGLEAADINPLDMKIFTGPAAFYFSIQDNYLTVWGLNHDAPHFDVRSTGAPQLFALRSEICQPDLIMHTFISSIGVRLIQGNLHIRIPHKKKVKTSQRQFIVKQALKQLENEALQDSATQPVALLLVRDCNLVQETAGGCARIAT